MRAEAESFPGYDFHANKGYPCPRHKLALAGMGPTSIHRRTWAFMESLPWTGIRRVPPGRLPAHPLLTGSPARGTRGLPSELAHFERPPGARSEPTSSEGRGGAVGQEVGISW